VGGSDSLHGKGGEDDNIESWLQNPKVLRTVNEARQDGMYIPRGRGSERIGYVRASTRFFGAPC
jgi:hypothetical protein